MSYTNKNWLFITSAFIFVFFLLLSIQGVDFSDEGYVLFAYQNIFHNPGNASYSFPLYLTIITGGIWNEIFGFGGWYSFRIFNAIIIVISYWAVCYTLKDYWKYKWFLFLSFILVLLNVVNSHGTQVFHYYTFSAFWNCIIALLLYNGFKNNNNWLVSLSSFLLGINVFVRIPNLTLCCLPFVLALLMFVYNKDRKVLWKQILVSSASMMFGFLLVLCFIFVFHHQSYFFNSIQGLIGSGTSSSDMHGIFPMLILCVEEYIRVAIMISVMAIYTVFGIVILKKIDSKVIRVILLVVLSISAIYLLYQYRSKTFILIAIILSGVILSYFKYYREKNVVLLISLTLLITLLQPLGSTGIITNMGPYAIWLALPFSLIILLEVANGFSTRILNLFGKYVICGVVFCLILIHSVDVLRICYRDDGPRFKKTYVTTRNTLMNIHTSQERAKDIDGLIEAIEPYVEEGDTILCWGKIPGLHYITKTVPFLDNPWPEGWQEGIIDRVLDERIKTVRPIIIEYDERKVFTLSQTIYNYNAYNNFKEKYGYHVVWEGERFKVYK